MTDYNICKTCRLRHLPCTTMDEKKLNCEYYIKEVPYYKWKIVWNIDEDEELMKKIQEFYEKYEAERWKFP